MYREGMEVKAKTLQRQWEVRWVRERHRGREAGLPTGSVSKRQGQKETPSVVEGAADCLGKEKGLFGTLGKE